MHTIILILYFRSVLFRSTKVAEEWWSAPLILVRWPAVECWKLITSKWDPW